MQAIRTGVKAFDRLWDGTVLTHSGGTHTHTLRRFVPSDDLEGLRAPVRFAIESMFDRGCGWVYVYYVFHTTVRAGSYVDHGYVVTDEDRFPWHIVPSNRRAESRKVLDTVKIVVDQLAWNELQARMEKEIDAVWDWQGIVDDVNKTPYHDIYDPNNEGIVGKSWLCSYPVMREDMSHLTGWLRSRMIERKEFELEQYIDETIDAALDVVAAKHDLYCFTDENEVFASRSLLRVGDRRQLAVPQVLEYDDYPDGYGHTMASPAVQKSCTLPEGTDVEIVNINGVNDIVVEAEHEEHTVTLTVAYCDLKGE